MILKLLHDLCIVFFNSKVYGIFRVQGFSGKAQVSFEDGPSGF